MTAATARRAIWFIVIGAVGLRLLIIVGLSARGRGPEVFEYEVLATNLLNGLGLVYLHNGQLYQAFHSSLPFIALNAAVCGLTAHRHVFLLAAQAILAGILIALVARIGTRVANARAGLIAAALTALHPGLVYYDTHKLHPLGLDALLIVATVLAFMELTPVSRWPSRLATGMLAGLALMERGSLIALAGLATLAVAVALRGHAVAAARFALPIAFGTALVLGPWVARNAVVLGTPVMMTSSGENFWRGNNAGATGTSLALDGTPVLEHTDPAFQAKVRTLDELGQMQLFWAESRRFWRESPSAALQLTARKLYYFYAFPPTAGLWYTGWLLAAYAVYYVLEIIAVVVGLRSFVLTPSPTGLASTFQRWLPLVAIVSVSLVQSAFYVESRHRWGVEPLMLVFAGIAVSRTQLIAPARVTPSACPPAPSPGRRSPGPAAGTPSQRSTRPRSDCSE